MRALLVSRVNSKRLADSQKKYKRGAATAATATESWLFEAVFIKESVPHFNPEP